MVYNDPIRDKRKGEKCDMTEVFSVPQEHLTLKGYFIQTGTNGTLVYENEYFHVWSVSDEVFKTMLDMPSDMWHKSYGIWRRCRPQGRMDKNSLHVHVVNGSKVKCYVDDEHALFLEDKMEYIRNDMGMSEYRETYSSYDEYEEDMFEPRVFDSITDYALNKNGHTFDLDYFTWIITEIAFSNNMTVEKLCKL